MNFRCVLSCVMIPFCLWVSFDYCRFIELDYTPMESGIMVSMRQSRGFLTPKSPEHHCRSALHHTFCLVPFSFSSFLHFSLFSVWHCVRIDSNSSTTARSPYKKSSNCMCVSQLKMISCLWCAKRALIRWFCCQFLLVQLPVCFSELIHHENLSWFVICASAHNTTVCITLQFVLSVLCEHTRYTRGFSPVVD